MGRDGGGVLAKQVEQLNLTLLVTVLHAQACHFCRRVSRLGRSPNTYRRHGHVVIITSHPTHDHILSSSHWFHCRWCQRGGGIVIDDVYTELKSSDSDGDCPVERDDFNA